MEQLRQHLVPATVVVKKRAPTPVPAKLRQMEQQERQQQLQRQQQQPKIEKKAQKKRARGFRQRGSGLRINIQGSRKSIKNMLGRGGGKMEDSAPVVLAAFLEDIAITLLASSAAHANASGPNMIVNSSHLQKAITSNGWLRKTGLLDGRVLGAARSATVDPEEERERDRRDAIAESRNKNQRRNKKNKSSNRKTGVAEDEEVVNDE